MDSFKFLLKRGDTVCSAVDGTTVLLEAIARRRPDFVRYLVVNSAKLGLDVPKARDCHGRTALFHAIAVGSREITDRLIESGCSLTDVDRRGRTVIMEAALHGQLEMLKYLAELCAAPGNRGLSFNASDDDGRNVLFYCVESGNIQLVDYVLTLGVRHRPDASGRTALMQAARTGNPIMTMYLLDRVRSGTLQHLEVDGTDCRGETALHYAIRSGSVPVVTSLIDDGRLLKLNEGQLQQEEEEKQEQAQQQGKEGAGSISKVSPVDPIELALDDRRLADVCRLLLDRVPRTMGIGRRDRLGRTPLFRFVEHGQLGMLRRYAVGNYTAGDKDQDGKTLLIYACSHSNMEQRRVADIVKYIVDELGADLTAVDRRGRTALYCAVEAGQLDAVNFLLSKWTSSLRSSPPSTSSANSTPSAATSSSSSSAASLLADATGRSMLIEAVASCRPHIVAALLESPAVGRHLATAVDSNGRGPVHHWALQPEPEKVGVSPSSCGSDGAESDRSGSPGTSTAGQSSTSTRGGRVAMLLTLVAHRCDVNSTDRRGGLTPLMIAARAGRASTVNALLNHLPRDVVRVNAVDDKRRTALHHCCAAGLDDKDDDFGAAASNPASLRCCRALVRAGIDVNAADKLGRTALMLACQSYVAGANVSVIRYLVEHGGADPVRQDCEGRDSFDYCPPIDSDYVRAVLREGAEMAKAERNALRQFADRLITMQQQQQHSQNHYNYGTYMSITTSNGGQWYPSMSFGIANIHIASVLRGLIREGIFTRTLSFEVMKQAPSERLRKLVDLLCCRGDRAFSAFCRVLKDEAAQPELAYMMMKAAYCRQQEIFC